MMEIRKAAVLGAGLMGATVAAQLANAGIPTVVLDLPPTETAENGLKALAKARPAPLAHKDRRRCSPPATSTDDLGLLADVDWVDRGGRRGPRRQDGPLRARGRAPERPRDRHQQLVGPLDERDGRRPAGGARPRFFGAHFFNPPRYMYLLEVIPTRYTDPALVDDFADFASLRLGKGVVRCNDAADVRRQPRRHVHHRPRDEQDGRVRADGRRGGRGQRAGHRPRRDGDLRHRRPGRLGHPRAQRRRRTRATRPATRCSSSGRSRTGCWQLIEQRPHRQQVRERASTRTAGP